MNIANPRELRGFAITAVLNRVFATVSNAPGLIPSRDHVDMRAQQMVIQDVIAYVLKTMPHDGFDYVEILKTAAPHEMPVVVIPVSLGLPIDLRDHVINVAARLGNANGAWNFTTNFNTHNVRGPYAISGAPGAYQGYQQPVAQAKALEEELLRNLPPYLYPEMAATLDDLNKGQANKVILGIIQRLRKLENQYR